MPIVTLPCNVSSCLLSESSFKTTIVELNDITMPRYIASNGKNPSMDAVMNPIAVHSRVYNYETDEEIPEQTVQPGDLVKRSVFVHQK